MNTPGAPAMLRTLFPCMLPVVYTLSRNQSDPVDNLRGLFGFASTALVLSLYNVHARHITIPNAVVGMALFYGGLAEFLAGMWAFAAGNVLGATSE